MTNLNTEHLDVADSSSTYEISRNINVICLGEQSYWIYRVENWKSTLRHCIKSKFHFWSHVHIYWQHKKMERLIKCIKRWNNIFWQDKTIFMRNSVRLLLLRADVEKRMFKRWRQCEEENILIIFPLQQVSFRMKTKKWKLYGHSILDIFVPCRHRLSYGRAFFFPSFRQALSNFSPQITTKSLSQEAINKSIDLDFVSIKKKEIFPDDKWRDNVNKKSILWRLLLSFQAAVKMKSGRKMQWAGFQ